MDNLARLLLRLLLVPLGYLAAVAAGAAVILIGEWRIGTLFEASRPEEQAMGFVVAIAGAVVLLLFLLSRMWLVAAVGILFSEAFAVRSWMFHAANGAASAWIACASGPSSMAGTSSARSSGAVGRCRRQASVIALRAMA